MAFLIGSFIKDQYQVSSHMDANLRFSLSDRNVSRASHLADVAWEGPHLVP